MRRRRVLVAFAVLAVLSASAGVIHAITNGVPDGNRHPYVGFLLFSATDANNQPVYWFCSGSLIAPRVVLTAGHCTFGAESALVTFESDLNNSFLPVPAESIYTHPGFSWNWHGELGWASIDTGVVILAETHAPMPTPALLPEVGLVDHLPMKTPVSIVGYGGQFKLPISGPPHGRWTENGMRYYAPSQIVASNNLNSDMWLKLTANPGQGKGGICFGDSGGPDLLGDTILATNSFVTSGNCTGVDYSNRVDRQVVLDWVNGCLADPNLICQPQP